MNEMFHICGRHVLSQNHDLLILLTLETKVS